MAIEEGTRPRMAGGESHWARSDWESDDVNELIDELMRIRGDMLALESSASKWIEKILPLQRPSARNLLHYVALRRNDIRTLQEKLVTLGLSSLGRCEGYVMANLQSVLSILNQAAGAKRDVVTGCDVPSNFEAGRAMLTARTKRLFGDHADSDPPIMVTMPSAAAEDGKLVHDLLAAGMNVMRINCAHDDRSVWSAIIDNLRQAEQSLGKRCMVAMDVAGPKIRTGEIEPGPQVVRWKPDRDAFGRVSAPARVHFSAKPGVPIPEHVQLSVRVAGDWWKTLQVGDVLRFRDARGRRRKLEVVSMDEHGFVCEAMKSAYITPQTRFRCRRKLGDAETAPGGQIEGRMGPIAPLANKIVLHKGDSLRITHPGVEGHPARLDADGERTAPASIGCTLPRIFQDIRAGDRVLLDDGKLAGVIREASEQELRVEITRAREGGRALRADKGINFPDSDLKLPALTEKDIDDLEFIVSNGDILSYSFVRRPNDIRLLHEHLQRLGRPDMPIILKIENQQAFENLPLLLLEVMGCSPSTGVMIARGDLAVECGWERLVEVQEQILWMCEAAHMPVIWATQILEGLAKKGLPTRAEVTDAGMGARAECVMLNKGPNIVETVQTLHDILQRMQAHQTKKRSMFRRLRVADRIFQSEM